MMSQDLWLAVLSASFGLWAIVVGWAANAVVKRIDGAVLDLKELDRKMQHWMQQTENRITRLETVRETSLHGL